ncbi:MAG: arginine--tRNA ligase [Clostridia bacterium]|nr:arginine--tRNA ligase [Clostridia bacterium]
MINFKKEIAKQISKNVDISAEQIETYIEVPKDSSKGDYAFPCFRLAKELKKSPQIIAQEIEQKLQIDQKVMEKAEVVGAYINFYINKQTLAKEIIDGFQTEEIADEDGESDALGTEEKVSPSPEGDTFSSVPKASLSPSTKIEQNIVIDYSAPNIAKPFHIGHLRSTVIGQALYNIYKYLGYNVTGVNHLGDYGTQFGKMIEGYKMWGDEYDIENDPINELTKIYVRINNLCKEDENVLQACRDNFKKLEDGDEYCTKIWNKFKELSLKEFQRVYDLLGVTFDSYNGEAFYSDKMDEVVELLEKAGVLKDSQGAKVVEMEDKNMPPLIVIKSNGSTTYATRDLAAILYRARTYDFTKDLYVVSYEQTLHFKELFEVAKYLGLDEKYLKGLEHVPFGMVQLKSGKMSTREGNVIKLEDLLNEAISRAKNIIEQKNPDLENKEEVAQKVGIGAIVFNDLANSRIKDEIFDWDEILNFQGETGPYIQYTYVRTKSVVEKAGGVPAVDSINSEYLIDEYSTNILKLIYNFEDVLVQVTDKNEPSILSRYLIDLAKAYSSFYNENKIINDDKDIQNARVYLTFMVGTVLKTGAQLLGIQMPDKM